MRNMIKFELMEVVSLLVGISEVYMFGSSIHSDAPNDVDLLLVYEDNSMVNAIHTKNRLIERLESLMAVKRPIDVILFSRSELNQTKLLSYLDHIILK